MSISIHIAQSSADLQAVYRLRYYVYVEEKGYYQKYADSVQKTIHEPEDGRSIIFIALDNTTIVGTLRLQINPDDFGYYIDLFHMKKYIPFYPSQISITGKFIIHPKYRLTSVALQLAIVAFKYWFENGYRVDFICCYKEMMPFVKRLGYRQFHPDNIHPEYGLVSPMVLVNDPEYLSTIRSPIYSHRIKFSHEKKTAASVLKLIQQLQEPKLANI